MSSFTEDSMPIEQVRVSQVEQAVQVNNTDSSSDTHIPPHVRQFLEARCWSLVKQMQAEGCERISSIEKNESGENRQLVTRSCTLDQS